MNKIINRYVYDSRLSIWENMETTAVVAKLYKHMCNTYTYIDDLKISRKLNKRYLRYKFLAKRKQFIHKIFNEK